MGVEQIVHFPEAARFPPWSSVKRRLEQAGFPVQVRMIDGELSFPDEEPPEPWRELRIATPAGMITARRAAERLLLIVWGNADEPLLAARNALAWAFAADGGGTIEEAGARLAPDQFRQQAQMPDLRA